MWNTPISDNIPGERTETSTESDAEGAEIFTEVTPEMVGYGVSTSSVTPEMVGYGVSSSSETRRDECGQTDQGSWILLERVYVK